ncbi:MAG: hypothetical protein ACTHMY_25665 [Solirubrobacteraceae bacterium]
MIRHAVCTVSAAATLALTAAAPAIACDHPAGTATPQAQTSPQAQQEHAKFAQKGFFRHHHRHHLRGFDQQAQPQSTDQRASDSQQRNCDHGDSND